MQSVPVLVRGCHAGVVAASPRLELEALTLAFSALLGIAWRRCGLLGALLPELLPQVVH